jgi:(2R)-ethylmalonyl-CoA mutase
VSVVSEQSKRKEVRELNSKVKQLSQRLGRNLKILIGKPGLDGHSNGAEQIAVKARDVGMEVVYEGIRMTPEQIAESALQEGVHAVGLSILSGSHLKLVPEVITCIKQRGLERIPVILGGIIPQADIEKMHLAGIQKIYTPKDYDLNQIMSEIIDTVAAADNID